MDSLFDDPRFVQLGVVLDEIEGAAEDDLTEQEIEFVEERWTDGAQCPSCGRSSLSGIGGLCLDCEVERPRKRRSA